MNRKRLLITGRRVLLVAGLAAVVFLASFLLPPAREEGEPDKVVVIIPRGAKLSDIADTLRDHGLIRNKSMFVLASKAMGVEKKLKAGRFRLDRDLGTFDVLSQLVEGMSRTDLITIPEGLTAREIADLLQQEILLEPEDFMALVNDSTCAVSLGLNVSSLEGYLFPDTYAFTPGVEPYAVIRMMVTRGKAALGAQLKERGRELGLDWNQVITFASIVEGEAQVPGERSRIAAVFWNRLRRGWRLQADPTVAYALGERKQRIMYRDLNVESPYNTYLLSGLPPGPINSPGKAAVLAVLYPLEGCRDMYFVARGDGTHIFSRTMKEHEAAIREVKAARRAGASRTDGSGPLSPDTAGAQAGTSAPAVTAGGEP